jgi:hypothetical protein
MSRAAAVTASQLARTIKALASAGVAVRGARVYPDGSVSLLTEAERAPPVKDEADWIDLLGQETAHHA